MPPRRSAAAVDADAVARCPTLLLIMEQGPLEGQICGYKPGSRVQIGRIARGNTLAIKDAGVSSKHLLIQAGPESDSDGGNYCWTITDLGSSNGSILNGEELAQSDPVPLSDGDIVKIGEHTSIKVKFEANENEGISSSKNVRGRGRGRRSGRGRGRGRGRALELGIIDENSDLVLEDDCKENNVHNLWTESTNGKSEDLGYEGKKIGAVKENVRRRSTRRSVTRETENVGEFETKMENVEKVSLRRTRSSNRKRSVVSSAVDLADYNEKTDEVAKVEVMQGKKVEQLASRKTRSSNKGENLVSLATDLDDDNEKSDEVPEVEVKDGRKVNQRVTRSSKNALSMSEDVNAVGNKDLGPDELNGGQRVGVRTRSSRNEGNACEAGIDLSVLEGKRAMKGRRGRKQLQVEISKEKEEAKLGNKEREEEEEEVDKGDKEKRELETGVEAVHSGREGVPEVGSTSGVKENNADSWNKLVLDLDKITMGEWFDYLEVFLPKQIVDETEKMISEMKQKVERLHEYMQQQQQQQKS